MDDDTFDDASFEAWVAGDARRRSIFDTMWRRIMGSDMDAALSGSMRRGASRRALVAGSAAVLLVLAGGYAALPLIQWHLAKPVEYAVANQKIREVMLADGSRITLAGPTRIEVRYTRHDRVVELVQGTIFADVAHDARRPFLVRAGTARIEDVGTSFEVSSKPGKVRVIVTAGVVRFGKKGWFGAPIDLAARQAAELSGSGLERIADVAPDKVANWRREWAEYKGASLKQVIADLQTLSLLPIEIADAGLSSKPVSGRIRLTDPSGQLENLAIIYDFKVRRTADALVISLR